MASSVPRVSRRGRGGHHWSIFDVRGVHIVCRHPQPSTTDILNKPLYLATAARSLHDLAIIPTAHHLKVQMSSPYTPSIPRSTLPLPSRRGAGGGLKPQTQTIGGSVTSATSRQPAHHGQPDPGQIDAGLEEMLKGLEGLERDLVGVFDGV